MHCPSSRRNIQFSSFRLLFVWMIPLQNIFRRYCIQVFFSHFWWRRDDWFMMDSKYNFSCILEICIIQLRFDSVTSIVHFNVWTFYCYTYYDRLAKDFKNEWLMKIAEYLLANVYYQICILAGKTTISGWVSDHLFIKYVLNNLVFDLEFRIESLKMHTNSAGRPFIHIWMADSRLPWFFSPA